jgi:hypothetical protein
LSALALDVVRAFRSAAWGRPGGRHYTGSRNAQGALLGHERDAIAFRADRDPRDAVKTERPEVGEPLPFRLAAPPACVVVPAAMS